MNNLPPSSIRVGKNLVITLNFSYPMISWHQCVDERSRELHTLIAEKIRRDPSLLTQVQSRLERWLTESQDSPRTRQALEEWQGVLRENPLEVILAMLASSDEEACRMRQSTPFVGILSKEERTEVFRKYEAFRS